MPSMRLTGKVFYEGGKNGHLEGMNTKAARKENCGTSPLTSNTDTQMKE